MQGTIQDFQIPGLFKVVHTLQYMDGMEELQQSASSLLEECFATIEPKDNTRRYWFYVYKPNGLVVDTKYDRKIVLSPWEVERPAELNEPAFTPEPAQPNQKLKGKPLNRNHLYYEMDQYSAFWTYCIRQYLRPKHWKVVKDHVGKFKGLELLKQLQIVEQLGPEEIQLLDPKSVNKQCVEAVGAILRFFGDALEFEDLRFLTVDEKEALSECKDPHFSMWVYGSQNFGWSRQFRYDSSFDHPLRQRQGKLSRFYYSCYNDELEKEMANCTLSESKGVILLKDTYEFLNSIEDGPEREILVKVGILES